MLWFFSDLEIGFISSIVPTNEREFPCLSIIFGGLTYTIIQSLASSETYGTSCEVYRRHMSVRKKGRHPLWIPQPNLQLPLDYRRHGTQVGDVGIITEDGAFDFMFNICHPATGSVDQPNLPAGFQPIYPPVIPEKEVVVLAEHSARDALTSRGISKQILCVMPPLLYLY